MRLVDADNLCVCYGEEEQKKYGDDFDGGVLFACDELSKNAPTVDAVPVVRCEDCKHKDQNGYCTIHQKTVYGIATLWWKPTDDYFCADGERKGGDE